MDRVTLTAAAGHITSANAAMEPTFAQEGPVGALSRCNNGFLQHVGFWSILGEASVPVHLQVRFDELDPLGVELEWTGTASQFLIHRSTDASVITDPASELGMTSSCMASDSPPPSEPIIYYLVLPAGS